MKKIVFVITLLTLLQTNVLAQSAEWLVAPEYSEIKYFGPQMYKVTKDNKVGIISTDGKVLVKPIYDAISLFYEGRAIFVNRTSQGWQVKGVLMDDGNVNFAEGEYFLLKDYMFYSEGLLPVRDEYGKYGYLNDKCRPAFAFFDEEVRPFSEGFAAVGNEETFHWVNTSGEQILPRLKNGGTPYGGTNFYDGKAYLWDEDGVFFILSGDGRTTKINSQNLVVDYLYRVGSDKGEDVEYANYSQSFSNNWIPEERNGKWTLSSQSGKLLSPFIYDHIQKFSGKSAVAAVDGHYGLIQMVDDNSTFSTHASKTNHIFSAGTVCNCEFQLSVPEKWRNQPITVLLKDPESGSVISIENKGRNNYSFSYKPDPSSTKEEKDFRVEVKNNGIQLWQGQESFTFVQRTKLSSSIRVNNADANSNDRCLVTATIKNPSSIEVTTTVTLSGGGNKARFENKTVTLTIPPHSSRSITSTFLVKNVELNGWCAVSTSDGTSSRRSNLELKPF